MDGAEFRNRLENLWATRPVRPSAPRTVAGVCAGVADRYRVDPTLVKVAFVVSTLFGGSGLILYLAGWIAFPSVTRVSAQVTPPGGQHPGRTRSPMMLLLVVLVVIVLVTSIGSSGPWSSGGLLGGLLMLFGWWLLYLRTPEAPAGTSVATIAPASPPAAIGADHFVRWTPRAIRTASAAPAPAQPAPYQRATEGSTAAMSADSSPTPTAQGTTIDLGKTPAGTDSEPPVVAAGADDIPTPVIPADPIDRTPPAWDPLGAARFAWDLPEPSTPTPPAVPESPRRSPLGLVVAGLAVIVAAAGIAGNRAGIGWFSVPHVLSLALAVVAVGLLVGALRKTRSGRHAGGLVPVLLALMAAVVVSTTLTTWSPSDHGLGIPTGGVGDRNWKPLSENDIRGEYSLGMGTGTLDLRDITLSSDRTVQLRNGIGELVIEVPAGMNVRADCSTGVGDYSCPDGLDGGNDGTAGPVLTVDAHTGMGRVEIRR
ncbi:PspC domain-containing protein [Gordonia desulfuricans]|uniref:PspC domain-containing protein n=1 Tax=Gordonia desulfuricans TaxID=89051 RepID=A0A7K3LLC6_9ACTN|nr:MULTISPECIES: PspC domain-containing protein [Gordonia]NDK89034.1 PspC domain-containing protein [Gordonia desulfuricans]WLP91574.1 PspC domain-containing protein [Gordonia sp. NB41Y]